MYKTNAYSSFRGGMKFLACCSAIFSYLVSCSDEKSNTSTDNKENSQAAVQPYTIIKSNIEGNDATYRVQVGDTLPNEQESIAIFKEVAGIKDGPAERNTAVYFTRSGFSANADAHAYVRFTKSDEAPQYKLQSASNARMKEAETFTFDSLPEKKLVAELLDAQGSKIAIYKKGSNEYFKVVIFSKGSYDIEPMKPASGNSEDKIVISKKEDDETFTYKEDETGTMIEVYNGNNSLFNSYKILKKG